MMMGLIARMSNDYTHYNITTIIVIIIYLPAKFNVYTFTSKTLRASRVFIGNCGATLSLSLWKQIHCERGSFKGFADVLHNSVVGCSDLNGTLKASITTIMYTDWHVVPIHVFLWFRFVFFLRCQSNSNVQKIYIRQPIANVPMDDRPIKWVHTSQRRPYCMVSTWSHLHCAWGSGGSYTKTVRRMIRCSVVQYCWLEETKRMMVQLVVG